MAHPDPTVPASDLKEGLLESVVSRLRKRKGQWREIGDLSNVPYDTVSKIARGVVPEPGVLKVERLDRTLTALDEAETKGGESPQLSLLAPGR